MSSSLVAETPGLLTSAWYHRWTVVAITLLGAIGAYALSWTVGPSYAAEAELILIEPDPQGPLQLSSGDFERYVARQEEFVTSTAVIEGAADALQGTSAGDVRGALTVTSDPELGTISVVASSDDPGAAWEIANAVTIAYQQEREAQISARAEQTIEALEDAAQSFSDQIEAARATSPADPIDTARIDVLVERLVGLQSTQQEVSLAATSFGAGLERIDEASVPTRPVGPAPRLSALGGLLAGLILGVAVAYWRQGRLTRIRTARDPERVLGAPLLGAVPSGLPTDLTEPPRPEIAEAFSFGAATVEYVLAAPDHGAGQTVLVTSIEPLELRAAVSANLAVAAAHDGRDVVLVDADLRTAKLSRETGRHGEVGLVDVAMGHAVLDQALRPSSLLSQEVTFVPAGTPPPGESAGFLRTQGFRQTMRRLRESADLVFLDAASLSTVADTAMMASEVDGILLVIPQGAAVSAIERIHDRLRFLPAPLIGYLYIGSDAPDYGTYGPLDRDTAVAEASSPEATPEAPDAAHTDTAPQEPEADAVAPTGDGTGPPGPEPAPPAGATPGSETRT